MADWSTTFSTAAVGSEPSGWSVGWNASAGDFPVVEYLEGIEDRSIRQEHSADGHRVLFWSAIGSIVDPRVLVRFRFTSNGVQGGIVLRGSGSAGSENGYVVVVNGANVQIKKFLAGVETTPVSNGHSLVPGRWYWLMARSIGTFTTYRIWEHGQADAVADQGTLNDSDISTGQLGFYAYESSGVRYYDYVRVSDSGTPTQPSGPDSANFDFADVTPAQTGLIVYEDFTQSDGVLGAPWGVASGDTGVEVVSNRMESSNTTGDRRSYIDHDPTEELFFSNRLARTDHHQIVVNTGDADGGLPSAIDGYQSVIAWTGGFTVNAEGLDRVTNGSVSALAQTSDSNQYGESDGTERAASALFMPGRQYGLKATLFHDAVHQGLLFKRFWLRGLPSGAPGGTWARVDNLVVSKSDRIVVKGLPDDYTITWSDQVGTAKAGIAVIHMPVGDHSTTFRFPDTDVVIKDDLAVTVGTLTSTDTAVGGDIWSGPEFINEATIPDDTNVDDAINAGTLTKIWRTTTSYWGNMPDSLPEGYTPRDLDLWNATKGKIWGGLAVTRGPGAGLVLPTIPKAHEQEVDAIVMFDSLEYSVAWANYWKIEWQTAGWILCGDGVYETDPSKCSGIYGYIQTEQPWPFGDCSVRGYDSGSLRIDVVSRGNIVYRASVAIPQIRVVTRNCGIPWIGLKGRVTREPSDATLNTMRIQAAYDLAGVVPDTDTNGWDLDVTVVANVPCGYGGMGHRFIETAWGGNDPGVAYFKGVAVRNIGEICVPDLTPTPILPPTVDVNVQCERIIFTGGPYTGPGTVIASRWVIRRASGSLLPGLTELATYGTIKAREKAEGGDIVYDSGFQSDNIWELAVLVADLGLADNTDYTVTLEYRDDLGNTTPASTEVPFRTATYPNAITARVTAINGNLITVQGSEFSSPNPLAVHDRTIWELDNEEDFGANGMFSRDPLIRYETTTPSELTEYTFNIGGLGLVDGDSIYIRVTYADQYGCAAIVALCLTNWAGCDPDLIQAWDKPDSPINTWDQVIIETGNWDTGGCKDC